MSHANFTLEETPDGVKLRVSMKDSYKAFAEQLRKDRPELSLTQIVALAINHGPTPFGDDYLLYLHWGIGYVLKSPMNSSWRYWAFDKTVAQVLDDGHEATLKQYTRDEMLGWYLCEVCGLVAHDPTCRSCSMSCPVCSVMVAEAAGLETRFVSSNDHLRQRVSYTVDSDYNTDFLGETPDETGSDDPVKLAQYANEHTKCALAAVILMQYYGGAEDIPMSPVTQKYLKGQTRPGADPTELRCLTLRHVRASDRCLAKVLTTVVWF